MDLLRGIFRRPRVSDGPPLFRRPRLNDDLHFWFTIVARRLRFRPPVNLRKALNVVLALVAATAVVLALRPTGLEQEIIYMAGIFVLAALLWVTEALPLFATALLVMGLEILLLANPGGWDGLGFANGASPDYRVFLDPLSDPIIVLFLGGFLMARAAIKEGVDVALAGVILRVFGGRPLAVMLGLMLITAFFSMFMSNTATTAMMITLVVPMLAQLPHQDPIRKGLVLSVPFAANLGGMGTPISSPPNAVAVAFLQQAGFEVSFLDWMLIAVPLALLLLAVTWGLLAVLFRPVTRGAQLRPQAQRIEPRGWYVIIVIVATIALWLTDRLHGLPTAVVALLPTVAFTATGLLGRRDFNRLEWHILILIAGGIALGVGMQQTGLDQVMVGLIPVEGAWLLVALVAATIVFSTFMSNTAAANLLLPIGISIALVAEANGGPSAQQLTLCIALAASTAMALPISTPPNAIAYAHGELETRDLALAGSLVSVLAAVLILAFGLPIIAFWTG
ncbi:MAG: DASS family sodium-coupled anion symporter [Bacteroidota bacterium]